MVDGRGDEHEFHFRTRLLGTGIALDAFEFRAFRRLAMSRATLWRCWASWSEGCAELSYWGYRVAQGEVPLRHPIAPCSVTSKTPNMGSWALAWAAV